MSKQQPVAIHLQSEADRLMAALVVQDAFPAGVKRWGRSKFAISRARQASTDNPCLRLRNWIRDAFRAGIPREQVQLLVVDLQSVIEEVYGVPLAFEIASRTETIHDAAEDLPQHDSLLNRAHLPEYVRAAKRHVAAQLEAIASAEREIARSGMLLA